jgi:hypothetical protein
MGAFGIEASEMGAFGIGAFGMGVFGTEACGIDIMSRISYMTELESKAGGA